MIYIYHYVLFLNQYDRQKIILKKTCNLWNNNMFYDIKTNL